MKYFFIIFLLLLFFVYLFRYSVLRILLRGIFGTHKSDSRQNRSKNNQTQQQSQSRQAQKIIKADEGEYVDFEEIKD
jgi:anionic cell wall polymer biosynthesis LytR-Cps2A-Psr (LCP) family protein